MAQHEPFIADDWWQLRFLTDLRLSPDGRRTAYTVESNDRAANETRSAIWMLDLATGESVPFTRGEQRDADPRWSPDGTLLALGNK